MNKIEARINFKEKYKQLSKEEKLIRKEELINLISNLDEFKKASKIAIYSPLYYEIDLTSLMELFPEKKFYFPRVVKRDLDFHLVTNLNNDLIPSIFNLKEPKEDLEIERNIDLYLVPCLSTSNKYRLGHGSGFYDRYFSKYNGFKVGITYPLFREIEIENNAHDIPMDIVL